MTDFLREYIFQYLPFVLSTTDGKGSKGIKLNISRILEMLIIGLVAAYFTAYQINTKVEYLEKRIERIEKSVQRVEDRLYKTAE